MATMSLIDWVGLVGPYVVFFVLLIVYYVWERKRERRLRAQYPEVDNGE